jgi:hypothetical protein
MQSGLNRRAIAGMAKKTVEDKKPIMWDLSSTAISGNWYGRLRAFTHVVGFLRKNVYGYGRNNPTKTNSFKEARQVYSATGGKERENKIVDGSRFGNNCSEY